MKHIKSIRIRSYRGFRREKSVDLALPSGLAGSGLTVITGPNNSGKSSILELVRALAVPNKPEFVESQRNKRNSKVRIEYEFEDLQKMSLTSTTGGSASTEWSGGGTSPLVNQIYHIPAARNIAPFFGKSTENRHQYSRRSVEISTERNQGVDPIGFLQTIEADRDKKRLFDAEVTHLLGFSLKWKLDRLVTGQYVFSISAPTGPHYSDGLGYGVLSVFYLVAGLMDSSDSSIITVDEPEISLHPQVQRRVADYLMKKSADTQIILATHSPYFVDPSMFVSGASLVRCYVDNDTTGIGQLSDDTREVIRRLSSGINNPHIFGLDAREVFFATGYRRVLVVEGQEDVVIVKRLLDRSDVASEFEIFGWGAGGAENVEYIIAVLQDLGIDDIATLVDGDKAKLHATLKSEFPTLKHAILPAADIRDKKARKAIAAKTGVCTSKGELKAEYEADVVALLNDLGS